MARGSNDYGQLGIGNTITQKEYVEIKLNKINQIACGYHHTVLLMEDGSVMGSGSNRYGQLGFARSVSIINQFIKIGVDNVKKIICYGYSTFFLLNNGKLLGCGFNLFLGNQLKGLNEVVDLPGAVIDIAGCESDNILLLLANGTLMGCGLNYDGQLRLGDCAEHKKFEIVQDVPKNISKIFTKEGSSVIQLSDGTLMGAGYYFTLGFDTTSTLKFQIIPNIPKNIRDFDRTERTMIILQTDDKIIQIGNKVPLNL